MSDAPKIVLDRLRAAAPREAHPDADVLTAFAEQALSGAERESVVRHLSRCGDCREVVALSLPPSVDVQGKPEPVAEPTPEGQPLGHPRSWFAWPTLRWAALAASVVVVASVLLLHPGKQPGSTAGTENAATQSKIQTPTSDASGDAASSAVTSTRSGPAQSPASPPTTLAESIVPGERRSAARDEQPSARAQAVPATSIADNKRLDSLQDKDSLSYHRRFAAPQPAKSGIVTHGELAAADQSAASGSGMATVSTADNAIQAATAQGSLMAKNDAPALPIEKAKPAVKEKAEMKSQPQAVAGLNKLAAAESYSPAIPQKTLATQYKKVVAPQWSLTQGKLQRSFDAGKTWQTALQLDRPILAFGALGNEVWSGAQGGTLFHSSDGGATWTTVQPSTRTAALTADIVAIEIRSATGILVSTSDGESWTTTDAGKTWNKK